MKTAIALIILANFIQTQAQQSAAGQDTLLAVVGPDFIMMGADSSSSGGGGIALTSSNIDKLAVVHDGGIGDVLSRAGGLSEIVSGGEEEEVENLLLWEESLKQQAIVVGFAGDAADADRLVGALKTHTQIREYEAGFGNDVTCVFDGLSPKVQPSVSTINNIPTTTASPVGDASGLDAEAIAYLARNEIASKLRSRQPLQLCLLVGGMARCHGEEAVVSSPFSERVQKQVLVGSAAYSTKKKYKETNSNNIENCMEMVKSRSNSLLDNNNNNNRKEEGEKNRLSNNPYLTPKLFWIDQYGSLQNLRYGAHGYGSNFALSILDQRYRSDMTRHEAVALIRECFEQLRKRYVINSPRPPRIKCVDAFGVMEIVEDEQ